MAATLMLAACSSSSGGPGRPSTASTPVTASSGVTSNSASSSSAPSTPVSTASSIAPATPVASPAESPAPVVHRHFVRPAGAKIVDFDSCLGAVGGSLIGDIEAGIFHSSSLDLQLADLPGLSVLAKSLAGRTTHAITAFRRAGYPDSFPVVQDLKTLLALYREMTTLAGTKNLDAIPSYWLRLSTAVDQYTRDGDSTGRSQVCES